MPGLLVRMNWTPPPHDQNDQNDQKSIFGYFGYFDHRGRTLSDLWRESGTCCSGYDKRKEGQRPPTNSGWSILGRCPHQDLSGRRYGDSLVSVEKWERSACPSVCGLNKTHPRRCIFQSAKRLNPNGRKPEGQGTQCAHRSRLGLARGCTPWNPLMRRLS